MNDKGQLSIIAALLVATILIATVAATYSLIRNNQIQGQPPIQSAIDETNLAIKQILSFTVGYYGSVLKVTGNYSYARMLATNYIQSGLVQIANMHPEWATSISMGIVNLHAYWFADMSYSEGDLTVTYNLTGLGISGMNYTASCKLSVGITNPTNNQACLNVTQDVDQPLMSLGKQNFEFFLYQNSSWQLTSPSTNPVAFGNGTYQISPPAGIDVNSYVIQVQDQRGIIVVASSFTSYMMNLTWPSITSTTSSYYYVNGTSNVDSNSDIGTHSNFTAQQCGPDNVKDTLTEADVPLISGDTQQFVQSNTSDLDGNGNIGTASNFTAEKYGPDSIYDTLTEKVNGTICFWQEDTSNYYSTTGQESYEFWSSWTTNSTTSGTIATLGIYVFAAPGNSPQVKLGIYDSSFGAPNNLLGQTNATTIPSNYSGWLDMDMVGGGVTVSPSTTYYIASITNTVPTNQWRYRKTASPVSFYKTITWPNLATPAGSTSQSVAYRYGAYRAGYHPYALDLEVQWTSAPYNVNSSKLLCIKTGTFSDEALEVDVWNGASWTVLNSSLAINAWNNISVSSYLISATFTIRFIDTAKTGDTVQSTWQIDSVLLHAWNSTHNYRLDLEEQWTNITYTGTNKYLDIFMGPFSSPAENLSVQWWNATSNSWLTLISSLTASSWNNVSITAYLATSTFTMRFLDGTQAADSVQSSWQIDTALLRFDTNQSLSNVPDTVTAELLQNGTVRWLGQSLQLTPPQAKPFPPIPTKAIHVNQTVNGIDSEVPFQIEDWASGYTVPLGLTSNASLFSGENMLVFLANINVSKVKIWWNGSDNAIQTPYAYTNRYFSDNVPANTLTNGILTLQLTNPGTFTFKSTVGSSSCTVNFMRVNQRNSTYGSDQPAYVITNGIVRDIIHQEPEWSGGVTGCSDFYALVVITLPANATYFTYQLSLMFQNTQQTRNIVDICPISLTALSGQSQAENGVTSGCPIVSNGTGLFYNSSSVWQHHWSQFVQGTRGAGIMFADDSNQRLYTFDHIAGNNTGALMVNSTVATIQLLPVAKTQVSFNNAMDATWYGAVATFDGSTPIYNNSDQTGLWMLVEHPPIITIRTGD